MGNERREVREQALCSLRSRRGSEQWVTGAFTCLIPRQPGDSPHKSDGVLTTRNSQGWHLGSEELRKCCMLGCQVLDSSKDPGSPRWPDFVGHEVGISLPLPHLRENMPLIRLQWLGLECQGCEDTLSSTHLGLPVAEGLQLPTWRAPVGSPEAWCCGPQGRGGAWMSIHSGSG